MVMTFVPIFLSILHQTIQFDIMHRSMEDFLSSVLAPFDANDQGQLGSSGRSSPNFLNQNSSRGGQQ